MERSEEPLVASVELEPIGTLVGCLMRALPARWSMNNVFEQDLCALSNAHSVDVIFLCLHLSARCALV